MEHCSSYINLDLPLQDLSEHNNWSALFSVDLEASKSRGEPVLRLLRLGEILA